MRDRLLLDDNPAKLYEKRNNSVEEEEGQQMGTEIKNTLIRRREYYSKRVKADFAPLNV